MNKLQIIFSSFIALALVGCIANTQVATKKQFDRFRQETVIETIDNFIETKEGFDHLAFNLQKVMGQDPTVNQYRICLYYVTESSAPYFPRFRPGQSLVVLLDGKGRLNFTSQLGGEGYETRSGVFRPQRIERYYAPITPAQIQQIAQAKKVEIKVEGETANVIGHFKPENFESVHQFLRDTT